MNQIQESIEILRQDYEDLRQKGYWFAAKSFGWGWVPITWQGWLGTLIYVFLVVGDIIAAIAFDKISHSVGNTLLFVAPSFLLHTTLFLLLAYGKGETPTWRWGIKRKDEGEIRGE
ncbi:MAG: hypothetical protein V4664_01280 [Patescibacteria group bacterium]